MILSHTISSTSIHKISLKNHFPHIHESDTYSRFETQRHMLQNCLLLVNLTHILLPSCAIIHPSFSLRNLPSKTVFHWTHAFQIRNRNVSQKRGKNQAHMSTLFNPGILHPSLNQYTIWYIQHVLYFTHCIDWLSAQLVFLYMVDIYTANKHHKQQLS